MNPGRRLHGPLVPVERAALRADAPTAAAVVLGAVLVRHLDGIRVLARIVEVEAYDEDDPASHSAPGRTRANAAMFADAGTAYVYRSYGVHWCGNVAVGPRGHGAAVLLRAAVVLEGPSPVRRRRPGARTDDALLRGPGCLTAGLGIDAARHAGVDLLAHGGTLQLATDGWRPMRAQVASGPRVGVSRASEVPWRWYLRAEPAVSRYRRSPRAGTPGTTPVE
jgi:DNA-3-methyladenine glycosylase